MADFETFPSCRAEALALAYATAKINAEITPEQLARIYVDAYERIKEELRIIRQEKT